MFPNDFPGMPPRRDVDFCIFLEMGTRFISIPSYVIAPTVLGELRVHIQELIDKELMRPSTSP